MDYILSTGTSSYGHTFGNVTESIKMDILSKFPKDFFKYINVSSKLIFRQFKKMKDNSLVEFFKQENPKMYIRPSYEVATDDIPFFNTVLTSHIMNGNGIVSKTSLMPIFRDIEKHIEMDFRMTRDRVYFDITIQVDTALAQMDLYKNMQSMISWDSPYTKVFSLESMIPNPMIRYIAYNANIEMDNSPGSIAVLLSYLHTHGSYPITYKIRNSTSSDEFFMYYQVPVLITYSDFSISDSNLKNMVSDNHTITFKVTCEFNHPSAYLIRSVSGMPKISPRSIRIENSSHKEIIPLYTLDRLFEDKQYLLEGFKLYFTSSFKTEIDKKDYDDFINLGDLLEENYTAVIKKYRLSNTPIDVLMCVEVYADNHLMELGYEYFINWGTMELHIKHSDPDLTYRVLIYANQTKFQEEFITLFEINKSDKTYAALNRNFDNGLSYRDREERLIKDSENNYLMIKNKQDEKLTEYEQARDEINL